MSQTSEKKVTKSQNLGKKGNKLLKKVEKKS